MGLTKKGDVYRFDCITLMPLGQNLFKLVSNCGTEVERLQGADAELVRDAVKDTLVSMSPQFGMGRLDKMKLEASRVSLSFVSHMREADISEDNTNAYKRRSYRPMLFSQGTALTGRQRQRFAVLLRMPSVQESH